MTTASEAECVNLADHTVLQNAVMCIEQFIVWLNDIQSDSHIIDEFNAITQHIALFRNARVIDSILQTIYTLALKTYLTKVMIESLKTDEKVLDVILKSFVIFFYHNRPEEAKQAFENATSSSMLPFMRSTVDISQLGAIYMKDISYCIVNNMLEITDNHGLVFPVVDSSPDVLAYMNVDKFFFHPGLVYHVISLETLPTPEPYTTINDFMSTLYTNLMTLLSQNKKVEISRYLHLMGLSETTCKLYVNMLKRRTVTHVQDIESLIYNLKLVVFNSYIALLYTNNLETYSGYIRLKTNLENLTFSLLYDNNGDDSEIINRGKSLIFNAFSKFTEEEFARLIHPSNNIYTVRYLYNDIMSKWQEILFFAKVNVPVSSATPITEEEFKKLCLLYLKTNDIHAITPYVSEPFFDKIVTLLILVPKISKVLNSSLENIKIRDLLSDVIYIIRELMPSNSSLLNVIVIMYNILNFTSIFDMYRYNILKVQYTELIRILSSLTTIQVDLPIGLIDHIFLNLLEYMCRTLNNDLRKTVITLKDFFIRYKEYTSKVNFISSCTYDINTKNGTVAISCQGDTFTSSADRLFKTIDIHIKLFTTMQLQYSMSAVQAYTLTHKFFNLVRFVTHDEPKTEYKLQLSKIFDEQLRELRATIEKSDRFYIRLTEWNKNTVDDISHHYVLYDLLTNERLSASAISTCFSTFLGHPLIPDHGIKNDRPVDTTPGNDLFDNSPSVTLKQMNAVYDTPQTTPIYDPFEVIYMFDTKYEWSVLDPPFYRAIKDLIGSTTLEGQMWESTLNIALHDLDITDIHTPPSDLKPDTDMVQISTSSNLKAELDTDMSPIHADRVTITSQNTEAALNTQFPLASHILKTEPDSNITDSAAFDAREDVPEPLKSEAESGYDVKDSAYHVQRVKSETLTPPNDTTSSSVDDIESYATHKLGYSRRTGRSSPSLRPYPRTAPVSAASSVLHEFRVHPTGSLDSPLNSKYRAPPIHRYQSTLADSSESSVQKTDTTDRFSVLNPSSFGTTLTDRDSTIPVSSISSVVEYTWDGEQSETDRT